MRRTFLACLTLLVLVLLIGSASAQSVYSNPNLIITQQNKHNFSSGTHNASATYFSSTFNEVCAFCHVAHQASGGVAPANLLWNHTKSAQATYGTYPNSATFQGATWGIQDVGGGITTSNLCLSCHDGTIAVNGVYKNPDSSVTGIPIPAGTGNLGTVTTNANLGTALGTSHPVNFDYDAAHTSNSHLVASTGTAPNGNVGSVLPLYPGQGGTLSSKNTIQCGSCHMAHDNTNGKFLRVSNDNQSGLCTTCHKG